MRWVLAFIVIIVGVLLVLFTEPVMRFVGRVEWAERHLGAEGGTRVFIKLLGVGAIFLGLFIGTGIIGTILRAIFSRGRI